MVLRIIPLLIASLLLAAHFLRHGDIGFMAVCLLVPLILLIKKRWSLILVQLSAYAGAAVWVYTALQIIRERMMFGRPWGVAVVILGAVALFTIFAGLLLNSRNMKDRYPSR
ncbi:MAG: hypothetical protein FJ118_01435 [Deltaproteobacteria bacterium]|nr:hypothetical protein [Deltaproteobacteria bacterium]